MVGGTMLLFDALDVGLQAFVHFRGRFPVWRFSLPSLTITWLVTCLLGCVGCPVGSYGALDGSLARWERLLG